MKIEEWPIDKVTPYENNPRKNDEAAIATANSIKEFGWQQPIVVDKDGVIIVGHTRLKAAKKLKLDKVPVTVAGNLTDEQAKAYRLADNKTGELADWDVDMLDDELNDILNIDMEDFGFDVVGENDAEVVDDDFDEEPPEEPTSKLGDVYQLGRHRLMCGDSTSSEQVSTLLGGTKADLFLTDPPYNVAYQGGGKDALTIKNDDKNDEEFHQFLYDAFCAAKDNIKSGASFYVWYSSSEVVNFHTSLEEAGFLVKQELIWNKNSLVLSRQDYNWKHEPCLYGWASGGSHSWYSDRKQTTVLNFDRPTVNKEHPTMKPIPLFDYQIKNSSKAGDVVLDTFGGSGTTIMACEQNGRCGYLMELDPRYVDVIIKRWEDFTGEKAVKISK